MVLGDCGGVCCNTRSVLQAGNCIAWVALYCNRFKCIARDLAGKAGVVSQYTEVYCDCGAKARLDCIAIQCPAKPRYGQEARSRRVGHAGGTGVQALGERAWQQARGERQGRMGRVARALGTLPGRAYGHGLGQVGALYT